MKTGVRHQIDITWHKKAYQVSKSWILIECKDRDKDIPKDMISKFADEALNIAEGRESALDVRNKALFATTAFLTDSAVRTLEKRAGQLDKSLTFLSSSGTPI